LEFAVALRGSDLVEDPETRGARGTDALVGPCHRHKRRGLCLRTRGRCHERTDCRLPARRQFDL